MTATPGRTLPLLVLVVAEQRAHLRRHGARHPGRLLAVDDDPVADDARRAVGLAVVAARSGQHAGGIEHVAAVVGLGDAPAAELAFAVPGHLHVAGQQRVHHREVVDQDRARDAAIAPGQFLGRDREQLHALGRRQLHHGHDRQPQVAGLRQRTPERRVRRPEPPRQAACRAPARAGASLRPRNGARCPAPRAPYRTAAARRRSTEGESTPTWSAPSCGGRFEERRYAESWSRAACRKLGFETFPRSGHQQQQREGDGTDAERPESPLPVIRAARHRCW